MSGGQVTLSVHYIKNSNAKTTLWEARVERAARVEARRPIVCRVHQDPTSRGIHNW
jgi:hypothetical protein